MDQTELLMELRETLARISVITSNTDKKLDDHIADVKNYVRKEEFLPVRNIAYGLVAVICTTVIGAVLELTKK